MEKYVILGAGGHARVIMDLLMTCGESVTAILDDYKKNGDLSGKCISGKIKDIDKYSSCRTVIAIGDNRIRRRIAETYTANYHSVIHPSAVIASDVKIGKGTVVMANAVINSGAKVGEHCIINTGAIIEHDSIIGDFTHISPGAKLGGTVRIGENVNIGLGANIKNNASVCSNVIVGAGATVVENIIDEGVYVGIPAKKIKDNKCMCEERMNIPFSPPDISELEIMEVAKTLRSGWITTGPRTKKLENKIARYVGTSKCVCLNSATAAMEMTLRILGVGPGDEVITSAYTYTATASVINHVGAKIVLIDTDGKSFEMDYKKLSDAITDRTKVIIPVDIGGKMCDYDSIYEIVNKKKDLFKPNSKIQKKFGRIIILADSAHGLGAFKHNKMSGSVADFTTFSFHAVKNFTTAEGGAVTWRELEEIDNEELYKQFMLASLHGQSKDALAKTKIGAWEYDIMYPAYKCNMTDIMAAIGLAQMDRYLKLLERRKEIIERYDKAFLPMGLKPLKHFDEENVSSGHLYLLRIPGFTVKERNDLINMMAERGIATNVHYKPLPMLTAYKNLGFDINDYPNAYAMYENEITLPLHTKLKDEEVEYICNTLKEILYGTELG